ALADLRLLRDALDGDELPVVAVEQAQCGLQDLLLPPLELALLAFLDAHVRTIAVATAGNSVTDGHEKSSGRAAALRRKGVSMRCDARSGRAIRTHSVRGAGGGRRRASDRKAILHRLHALG